MQFVAPTTLGAQEVLATELNGFGLPTEVLRGAVAFEGTLEDGYRACLGTRIASRILLVLGEFPARNGDQLYQGVHKLPWSDHIASGRTLSVHFSGTSPTIRNSRFGALKTKDAIVDRLRADTGTRPSIDTHNPDVRVHVRLANGRGSVSIDLAGAPLYKRGYGRSQGPAPLQESLAATLLHLAGWPKIADEGGVLVDPMCGSGTLLEEACGIASHRAPGLTRRDWGFQGWRGHEPEVWKRVVDEARQHAAEHKTEAKIFGSDIHVNAVRCAKHNLKLADTYDLVTLQQAAFEEVGVPETPGIVVTNPPYGERMEADEGVVALYRSFGDVMRRRWLGWTVWVLAGSPKLGRQFGLRPARKFSIHNGPIDCRFLEIPISAKPVHRLQQPDQG
jgi:23S rRNA (guanine2445-N2)-methyltransferase / 23S rRNA (guanine2069-N7)-methyltransferase